MAVSFCDGVLELQTTAYLVVSRSRRVSSRRVSLQDCTSASRGRSENKQDRRSEVPQEVRSDTSALAIIGVPFSFQDFVAALIVIFSAPLYRTLTHARAASHKQALYRTLTHVQQATNRYWSRRQTHTVLCFHSTTTC